MRSIWPRKPGADAATQRYQFFAAKLFNQSGIALYGLKWNPFSPELPVEAIYVPPRIENFCWRIEHAQIREGGFAMIHGDPGSGKSIVLRLLAERLKKTA